MEGGVSLFHWKFDHDWVQRTKIGQVSDGRWSCWNQLTGVRKAPVIHKQDNWTEQARGDDRAE
jgi:hypothetical protein